MLTIKILLEFRDGSDNFPVYADKSVFLFLISVTNETFGEKMSGFFCCFCLIVSRIAIPLSFTVFDAKEMIAEEIGVLPQQIRLIRLTIQQQPVLLKGVLGISLTFLNIADDQCSLYLSFLSGGDDLYFDVLPLRLKVMLRLSWLHLINAQERPQSANPSEFSDVSDNYDALAPECLLMCSFFS